MHKMRSPRRGVSEGERQAPHEVPEVPRKIGEEAFSPGYTVQGIRLVRY